MFRQEAGVSSRLWQFQCVPTRSSKRVITSRESRSQVINSWDWRIYKRNLMFVGCAV
jgi:hypothetical protein